MLGFPPYIWLPTCIYSAAHHDHRAGKQASEYPRIMSLLHIAAADVAVVIFLLASMLPCMIPLPRISARDCSRTSAILELRMLVLALERVLSGRLLYTLRGRRAGGKGKDLEEGRDRSVGVSDGQAACVNLATFPRHDQGHCSLRHLDALT